jgi:DNA-binding MarR family transcriptional regulator
LEKNVSIESNASQNENATSEIKGIEDDTGTDTSKAIEKQIVLTDKATQVLIKKKDHNDEASLPVSDFRINDNKILSLLNQETGANYYSFKGLMRKLNLHQQSLARALNRLQDLGLIERSDTGYKLTKNGILVLSKENGIESLDKIRKGKEFIQLLQAYVPVNVKSNDMIRTLIGKWFNNLRWTGLIESEMGCMLQWISDDGSFQINLRIISDYIVIETNAISYKEKIEAMIGSYRIFEHITKISQKKLDGINAYMMNINYNMQKQNN